MKVLFIGAPNLENMVSVLWKWNVYIRLGNVELRILSCGFIYYVRVSEVPEMLHRKDTALNMFKVQNKSFQIYSSTKGIFPWKTY